MTVTETHTNLTDEGFRSAASFEIRAASEGNPAIMEITFARFNEWVEIRSWREGRFLERLEPGAFSDTMAERSHLIRCLFDHGMDPSIGNKVLGKPIEFREDAHGPVAVVELFDRPYVDDLLPGLRSTPPTYGASYRFGIYRSPTDKQIVGETWNHNPGKSAHNPEGLPERSITRVNVSEMGPVTFPADEGTQDHLAMRSLTDRFIPNLNNRNSTEELSAGALEPVVTEKSTRSAAMAFVMAERSRRSNLRDNNPNNQSRKIQ